MAQKAKPGEKTLLELVSQGKIKTSEDIPELSESEIFSEWVLPAVTGASAETEDYQPGALDLALTIPVVGGRIKTGFKLAKEAAKKVGNVYRKSIRPRIAPEKDALLRFREHTNEIVAESDEVLRELDDTSVFQSNIERIQRQWATAMPEPEGSIGRTTQPETISDSLTERIRDMRQRLTGEPQAYQRGTYARQAEEAVPVNLSNLDNLVDDIIAESEASFPVSRVQARAIAEDIGIEGWDRFLGELRAMPTSEGRAFVENFMAKYRNVGVTTGDKAMQVYKSKDFKFDVSEGEESLRWVNEKRGTEHTLKQKDFGPTTKYELKIKRIRKHDDPVYSIHGNPQVSLSFNIRKAVDDVYGEVNEIANMSFFAHGGKRADIYAGRLLNDLLDKLPENTVINETSMTFDSFYMMLNQAVKKGASIVFDEGYRKTISPSSRGKWSKLIKDAKTVSERDEIIDGIMDEIRLKLKDYPKLKGRPRLSSEGIDIEYNPVKIHNITAAVAVALGLKNKEELEKLLAYDPESVESQIFDSDFSI